MLEKDGDVTAGGDCSAATVDEGKGTGLESESMIFGSNGKSGAGKKSNMKGGSSGRGGIKQSLTQRDLQRLLFPEAAFSSCGTQRSVSTLNGLNAAAPPTVPSSADGLGTGGVPVEQEHERHDEILDLVIQQLGTKVCETTALNLNTLQGHCFAHNPTVCVLCVPYVPLVMACAREWGVRIFFVLHWLGAF